MSLITRFQSSLKFQRVSHIWKHCLFSFSLFISIDVVSHSITFSSFSSRDLSNNRLSSLPQQLGSLGYNIRSLFVTSILVFIRYLFLICLFGCYSSLNNNRLTSLPPLESMTFLTELFAQFTTSFFDFHSLMFF